MLGFGMPAVQMPPRKTDVVVAVSAHIIEIIDMRTGCYSSDPWVVQQGRKPFMMVDELYDA